MSADTYFSSVGPTPPAIERIYIERQSRLVAINKPVHWPSRPCQLEPFPSQSAAAVVSTPSTFSSSSKLLFCQFETSLYRRRVMQTGTFNQKQRAVLKLLRLSSFHLERRLTDRLLLTHDLISRVQMNSNSVFGMTTAQLNSSIEAKQPSP